MECKLEWPHVIFSQQEKFTKRWLLEELFPRAKAMKRIVDRGGCDLLKNKRAISLFYQPSTRTAGSLAMAFDYLGGRVVFSTDNAREFSSAAKGETLEDSIRVWNRYRPDVIFLRYDREIGAEIAAGVSQVPIINAGDRQPKNKPQSPFSGQHPTQAFLDLYTIHEHLGGIDGISIAMVGDLRNGRTVRSLSYMLAKFQNVMIYYVSPWYAKMRDDVKDYLTRRNVIFYEETDLRQVASLVDVVYQTRSQTECGGEIDYNDSSLGYFVLNKPVLRMMRKNTIAMHPMPRLKEMPPEVDDDPRALHLTEQMDAGLYTRMALDTLIFNKDI